MTRPDEPAESFAAAFKELMELQRQIDESAQEIVNSVRVLVGHRSDYRPVRAKDYPAHDAAYYDGVSKELAAEGLAVVGDYEDATFSSRHPDKQVFVRLALAGDGTVGAMWFRLGSSSSISLHSWLEDGRKVTTLRAASESAVPHPPGFLNERVDLETSARDVARRHRSRVRASGSLPRQLRDAAELLTAFTAEEAAIAAFREAEGIALFEPMLRKKLGERYEEEGAPLVESIRAHPEWWAGEEPRRAEPEGGGFHLMFLRSPETTGRWHFTTAGLVLYGLPEIQMKQIAGNHCRAARLLMAVVARKLRDGATGPELQLERADVPHPNAFVTWGDPEVAEEGVARVLLVPEGFGDEPATDAGLIHLVPPKDYAGDKDRWLRESCRRLGQNAPLPLKSEHFEREMDAASRKAKATLSDFRARVQAGLPDDQAFLIKVGLPVSGGGREFVWVQVRDWTADAMLIGTLETVPHNVPGMKQGQEMRVREADVFDRAIFSKEKGVVEIALTDIVAQEFGVDV